MIGPQKSELCLEMRLPTSDGQPIVCTSAEGNVWEYTPRSLSQTVRSDTLWKQVDQDWPNRYELLTKAGAALGQWLFNERAVIYLNDRIRRWFADQPRLRIELRIPHRLAEYPWEIAACEGINHLSVKPALSVVRVNSSGAQQPLPPAGTLLCHVIGVTLQPTKDWQPLQTTEEVERVRQEIENAGSSSVFAVEIDQMGEWRTLVERYREIGPPHIFHFAGHGMEQGRGLVFRGVGGNPQEVLAQQVADILSFRVRGRQTHLAFLNACTSSAAGKGPYQPFGGVAELLIQRGIPIVVGLQTPVSDTDAVELSQLFYAALARGDTVDCALQEAREKLFLLGSGGVGWAFLNLTVAGQPGPLCQLVRKAQFEVQKDLVYQFGHEPQRQRFDRFLQRSNPLVVIVHGEERSGHRHVLDRVQFDLENRGGKALWKPIAALRLHAAGDPLVQRSQLAGGIARALELSSDSGTQKELEGRIAWQIAECCRNNQVLIVDLQEVVKFTTPAQATAILTLIQELWADIMEQATAYRSTLPVFLLVSVAYPQPVPEQHRNANKVREMIALTEKTITTLQERSRLKGNVRVEVLPKLEPFDEYYVAGFLEDTLELDPDRAESTAAHLVEMNDNETILERFKTFLEDWQQR
ncbi:MAG: CHAT domain-containing protein [Candidatus Binatia bacterium]